MNSIDWTEIIMALIGLLGTIITLVLVPYFTAKTKDFKASLTEKQRSTFDYWVDVAVKAFEVYYKESGQGPVKKERVKKFIRDYIETKELNITEAQLNLLIDSAVEDLINKPWEEFTGVAKINREIQRCD